MRVICLRLLISTALLAALLVVGAFGPVANPMPSDASVAIGASR